MQHKKYQNITSQIQPKLPTNIGKKSNEVMNLADFKQALINIHDKGRSTKNSYEKVIFSLEQIIE